MNAMLSEEDKAVLIDETPLMRIGEARDVAEAALFLAGEGCRYQYKCLFR